MGSSPTNKKATIQSQKAEDCTTASPPPAASFPSSPAASLPLGAAMIGQLLDRRYRIIKILGSNTFGQTYLAADTHRPGYPQCVVKQLRSPSQNPRTLQIIQVLFKKKAETLEKLSKNEHIPQLLAFFEENKEFYLVEEFIAGQPLTNEMVPGVPMSEEQVFRLLQEILEILAFVHEQGAMHGHLKPANIIRRQSDGKLVLLEFGAVKDIGSQVNPSAGPPSISVYRPTEQLKGNPLYNSDIYSLGAIAIQALTGMPEEELSPVATGEIVWQHRAQVSPELTAAIDKMVRPDDGERYQSAGEVLADLRKISEGGRLSSQTPAFAEPNYQKFRQSVGKRSRWLRDRASQWRQFTPILAGTAAVIVMGGLTLSLLAQNRDGAINLGSRGADRETNGDRRGAIGDYNLVVQINPNDAQGHYKQGNAKYDMGDYRGAIEAYSQAIRLSSNHANAYFNRGLAHYALKEYPAAVLDYGEALKLDRDDGDVYSKRAGAYFELADYTSAIADYTRAIQMNSNDAKAYIERGRARLAADDRTGAIADFNQAIRINPNQEDAYKSRGQARFVVADYQNAMEDYAQAIRINPKSADAYNKRCSAYLNLGDYPKAVVDCTSAIAISPNDANAYNDRCFAQFNLRDYQQAIGDCTKAIGLDSNNAKAYSNRGLARAANNDKSGAIDDYTKAIRIDPSDGVAYSNRAAAQSDLENYSGAIEDYTRALRLKPDYEGAYFGRGAIRAMMGDRQGAIEDFQKTSKLCLDRGNMNCYNNAQSQTRKLLQQ